MRFGAAAAAARLHGQPLAAATTTPVGDTAHTLGRAPALVGAGLGLGRRYDLRAMYAGEEYDRERDQHGFFDNHAHFENDQEITRVRPKCKGHAVPRRYPITIQSPEIEQG